MKSITPKLIVNEAKAKTNAVAFSQVVRHGRAMAMDPTPSASACAQLCDPFTSCAQAEQRSIEFADERATLTVQEDCDEQPANERRRRLAEPFDEVGAFLRRLAE